MAEEKENGGKSVHAPVDPDELSIDELSQMIDYTLLKPEKTIEEYSIFISTARQQGFKNVFVPPCYVPLASGMLGVSDVGIGVPVSFPFGYAAPEVKVSEALTALDEGAVEIDMVMNISAAVTEEWDMVEEDFEAVLTAIRDWERTTLKGPIVVKVILETPYLNDDQKREACRRAMSVGMDFVKTATGLGPAGATVEDVKLMRSVVGDKLGVKAAGGIRTWADARAMIAAGATRIGTSTGPEIIEDWISAGK